eukprot:3479568-Ditylum_brightwellii.AAC.1
MPVPTQANYQGKKCTKKFTKKLTMMTGLKDVGILCCTIHQGNIKDKWDGWYQKRVVWASL